MSLVGHNALDRVSKVFTEPNKVLDNLNAQVLTLLRKDIRSAAASIPKELLQDLTLPTEATNDGTYIGGQDGMDLGVLAINWESDGRIFWREQSAVFGAKDN